MRAMTDIAHETSTEPYRDPKRWSWLLSVLVPTLVAMGPALYLGVAPDPILLWLPLILVYGVFPAIDLVLGEDSTNPPEAAVPALEADGYYRLITYAVVPMLWIGMTFGYWFVARHDLPWYGMLAVVLTSGVIGGFGINLGHELGHKHGVAELWFARFALALCGYGHFYIEHNRGHHSHVATPEDPASARMGESIYAFALRELPGAAIRAWRLEAERLTRAGRPVWSLRNEVLRPAAITFVYWAALVVWLGPEILPVVLLTSFWGMFQLTSANYIEHYGLLRRVQPNGRVEICRPKHSWNSNHAFSNWALFNLQRHSDHHAHPLRRYQALRHFDEAPQLPNGYFGMFVVAYIPAWWYAVMDKRLVAAVGGDATCINFQPSEKARLVAKYGLTGA